MKDITKVKKITDNKAFPKLLGACSQAMRDGFEYIWIDTCCIDQSSSAELSEAINSMYRLYEASQRCYAYLDDVERGGYTAQSSSFRQSEWFSRAGRCRRWSRRQTWCSMMPGGKK